VTFRIPLLPQSWPAGGAPGCPIAPPRRDQKNRPTPPSPYSWGYAPPGDVGRPKKNKMGGCSNIAAVAWFGFEDGQSRIDKWELEHRNWQNHSWHSQTFRFYWVRNLKYTQLGCTMLLWLSQNSARSQCQSKNGAKSWSHTIFPAILPGLEVDSNECSIVKP